ncbi:MAG: ACT domain-containing protein [Brevundimonas sp.]
MAAISDLQTLLKTMTPELAREAFVFCTLPVLDGATFEALSPVVTVREAEGVTVVISLETARSRGIEGSGVMRMISLRVHSDLAAVGLTAAFATALTEAGVSANVVAGYHHDHIFVPDQQADDAMVAIAALQTRAQDQA